MKRDRCMKHSSHKLIATLIFLALVGVFSQTKASRGLAGFLYFSSSPWLRPTATNSSITHDGETISSSSDILAHSIAVIDNSSSLSKSEEKRQRAMVRLHDAIEQVLKWRKKDENMKVTEEGLTRARAMIKEALGSGKNTSMSLDEDVDYVPHGKIYRDAFAFHRSYLLMEKLFKIYIYEEGEAPLFHYGPCKDIYSLEGIFINSLEVDSHFRTYNPDEAHVFFLPFSIVMILEYLFDPIIRDKAVLERTILDYVTIISNKYRYWNRSLGADHFMLSCHDWGPRATWYHPLLYFHSIRVLCNANTSENFNPRKDASIPEINLETGEVPPLLHGLPPSERTILAFFAGGMHGLIRRPLLKHWKDKDDDVRVYEKLPEAISYSEMMKRSKYCICPSGFEVASPRIVEALYAECVPVLISQNYILPFSDVLNWNSFSVQVSVSDIPNLKRILMAIPFAKYMQLQEGVKQVQRHFVINNPPKRYDVFHMIIHSVWLRRLNLHVYS